jgi:hypothetical protein
MLGRRTQQQPHDWKSTAARGGRGDRDIMRLAAPSQRKRRR